MAWHLVTRLIGPKTLLWPHFRPPNICPILGTFSTAKIAKSEKCDKICTIPNGICMARIAVSPYLAKLIVGHQFEPALGIFLIAGFSDVLDGWIARTFPGQKSMLGSFLDPLADKILMTVLYLSLTSVDLLPSELAALVISRDVLLIYAGLYIRYMGVNPPFTFQKYFDVSMPTAQVNPTTISKFNTGMQLTTVAAALASPVLGFVNHPLLYALCGLTACTTFASSLSYAFQKDTYKFSNRSYDHQAGKKLTALLIFILFNLGFVYNKYYIKKSKPQL